MNKDSFSVLFLVSQPFLQWRGSPLRVYFDALALSELGGSVDLVTLPMGETPNLPPAVRLIRLANPLRFKDVPIGPSVKKALFDVIMLFKAAALLRRNRYDVIHGVEDAGVVAAVLGRWFRRPVVFEKHSDPSSHNKGALKNLILRIYAWTEAAAMRHARAVIGTGPGLAAQAQAVAPDTTAFAISDIPSSRVEADADEIAQVGSRLRRTPEDLVFMYVGSLAAYQGVDLLIEAIPAVVQRNARARFVILCNPSKAAVAYRSRLAERGVSDRVDFIGPVHPDRIPAHLAASDVLLSPRMTGTNTPLKLLDYLKAGRAILACDTDANRQVLDDTTALLVPARPESFADACIRLAEDSPLRTRLASAGRQRQQEAYTFGHFRDGLKRCYASLGL